MNAAAILSQHVRSVPPDDFRRPDQPDHGRVGVSGSPAIVRAAAIMSALAESPTQPIGPSELSKRTGVAKSTVIHLCSSLVATNLLRKTERGYLLGARLPELGMAYLRSVHEVSDFYDVCRAALGAVVQTTQLAVMGERSSVVFLARYDGTQPLHLGLASEIGRSVPAHCTAAGKALLAALPPQELSDRLDGADELATLTGRSIHARAKLDAELATARRQGYATEHGEVVPGVRCLGVAVMTPHRDDALVAVSFTFREDTYPDDDTAVIGDLHRFADAFGGRLGGHRVPAQASS